MSLGLVSFFFAVGAAAWIYNWTMNRTGGNTKNALIVAGSVGVALFIFFYLFMTTLEGMLNR